MGTESSLLIFTDWGSLLWSVHARGLQSPGLFLTTSFAGPGLAFPKYTQKEESDTFCVATFQSFFFSWQDYKNIFGEENQALKTIISQTGLYIKNSMKK